MLSLSGCASFMNKTCLSDLPPTTDFMKRPPPEAATLRNLVSQPQRPLKRELWIKTSDQDLYLSRGPRICRDKECLIERIHFQSKAGKWRERGIVATLRYESIVE